MHQNRCTAILEVKDGRNKVNASKTSHLHILRHHIAAISLTIKLLFKSDCILTL